MATLNSRMVFCGLILAIGFGLGHSAVVKRDSQAAEANQELDKKNEFVFEGGKEEPGAALESELEASVLATGSESLNPGNEEQLIREVRHRGGHGGGGFHHGGGGGWGHHGGGRFGHQGYGYGGHHHGYGGRWGGGYGGRYGYGGGFGYGGYAAYPYAYGGGIVNCAIPELYPELCLGIYG